MRGGGHDGSKHKEGKCEEKGVRRAECVGVRENVKGGVQIGMDVKGDGVKRGVVR